MPTASQFILTDSNGTLSTFAAAELHELTGVPVYVLKGGTKAWKAAGGAIDKETQKMASPAIDRFHRPYEAPEGDEDVTFNPNKIKEYIGWLSGTNLLKQLELDGTSGFWIL